VCEWCVSCDVTQRKQLAQKQQQQQQQLQVGGTTVAINQQQQQTSDAVPTGAAPAIQQVRCTPHH